MKNPNSLTIAGVLAGTILEWYDFSLIGSLAPIISTLFFPSASTTLSLLATFGVFATGFIARPIGGLVFGHIGDRQGRKRALSLSIFMMAIPTTLIGLLPDYHAVGMAAPIMLIILRFMQGFSSSGEYPGAICVMTEMAPENKRGFYGSIGMLGTVGGVFLGSIVTYTLTTLLSPDQINSWGWRIPFFLGIPLGFVGWILRRNMIDPSVFDSAAKHKLPIREVIQKNPFSLFKIISLFSLSTISFYLGFVYITGYLVSTHQITLHEGLIDNAISTICLALLIPAFGYLSDKVSRQSMIIAGMIGLALFFYPIFVLFTSGNILLGQIMLAVVLALYVGPLAATAAESFDASCRYSGISAGINIAATVFGGTCPLVATYLMQETELLYAPSIYPIFIAIICLIIILRSQEYTQRSPHFWQIN